ncbi:MAG TPA: DUF4336 domain-containing protein [Rudaea sp.]|nr:DUF4336 domain-containing protein [Rudaea sp.]
MQLTTFCQDWIWTMDYPIKLAGVAFNARMSVVRLMDGKLLCHSPGPIDDSVAAAIDELGEVRYILAPGLFHHMYVAHAQERYLHAETYICPGVERRNRGLRFDWILGPGAPATWCDTMDQALIRDSKCVWEVALLHKPSKTLLLVDSIEYFTDHTLGVNWQFRALWKYLLRMWNTPKPAPEYRFGWRDKSAVRTSLSKILEWDFDKIILSHGDNIIQNAKRMARLAWTPPLAPEA